MFIKNGSKTAFTKEQKLRQQKIHYNTSVKLRKSTQKNNTQFWWPQYKI